MKTYTAIIRIKTTIEAAAEECNAIFGAGGCPEADRQEHFFALGCTPIQGDGYCRVVVAEHIAIGLQYLLDMGETSENVDFIRVEWFGPDMVIELDEEGSEVVVHNHFIVGMTEEYTDEEGIIHPPQAIRLGVFA